MVQAMLSSGRAAAISISSPERVWHASPDISFTGGLLDGISASDDATWVDTMVGARGRYFLTDSVYLSGWGLIGAGRLT